MNKILSIAKHTFIGNVRNRIFLVLVLFGFLVLGSGVLMSVLGQEQEIRMLIDLGLASIETFAFVTAVFLSVNLLLDEIQSKTIYLALTRSVSKMQYLLGKYLGTLFSILACFISMTVLHLLLLFLKGWKLENDGHLYFISLFLSFEKVILISAAGLFFSLFATSNLVALVFTFFVWVLGHFALELKFLGSRIESGLLKTLLKFIYLIIPHFQYMNARDLWTAFSDQFYMKILYGSLYAFAYTAFCLALALITFRKKEF